MTSAGSAAGIDLCLHIVRKDYGHEIANNVAQRLVIQPHRHGEQPQNMTRPMASSRESQTFGALFDFYSKIWRKRIPLPLLPGE